MRFISNGCTVGRGRQRLTMGLWLSGVATLAFFGGRCVPLAEGLAGPPDAPSGRPARPMAASAVPEVPSDYSRRVVAYIHDSVPITREELGEYLISRYGAEKLELLVNTRIIEYACRQKGIDVTEAEIEAALEEDLKPLGVNRSEFVSKVLKQYHKNLYEWKQDVIRPRILLTKLLQGQIVPTEEEMRQAFENRFGEKVQCRIIMFPKGQQLQAMKCFEKVRNSDEEFDRAAKQQANPNLAATGGSVKPLARFCGHADIEREAFSLRPGEVSRVIETDEGYLILKCVRRVPPDVNANFQAERKNLEKDVLDKKVQAQIPELFKNLREMAHPQVFLKANPNEIDRREIERNITTDAKKTTPPVGN